jgi:hypothetical protein
VKKQPKVPGDKRGNIFMLVHRRKRYDRKLRQLARVKR